MAASSRAKKQRKSKKDAGSSTSSSEAEWEETGEDSAITFCVDDDTLLKILHPLPTRYLLSVVALVCRRWRRLCQTHLVHDLVPPLFSTHDKPWGSLTEQQLLELAKRHASTIETIELRGLKHLTSNEVAELLLQLPRLRHLTNASCPPLLSANFQNFVHQLPSELVTLDLHSNSSISCAFAPGSSQPLLPSINNEFLIMLQQRCPNLKELVLAADSWISDPFLDGLLRTWPALTLLHLDSSALGWSAVIRIFQSCRSLQDISLTSSLLGEPISHTHARWNNVEKDLRCPQDILSVDMPRSLVSLRLYSKLHVSVHFTEPSPAMNLLRVRGQQFRRLHAQTSYSSSWHNVSLWSVNLKCLDLSHAHQHAYELTLVEETVLCRLVRHLQKIEELALPDATDRILVELGRSCSNLSKLFFQGYRVQRFGPLSKQIRVTDRGVIALAEGCTSMRVLSLGGCRKVTVSSARSLAFHCRRLEVLELAGCTSWTDEAVLTLLPRLGRSLLLLDLLGCSKITSAILKALIQSIQAQGTSLRVLVIPNSIRNRILSRPLISHISKLAPSLSIRGNNRVLQWDGFYHCPPWSYFE